MQLYKFRAGWPASPRALLCALASILLAPSGFAQTTIDPVSLTVVAVAASVTPVAGTPQTAPISTGFALDLQALVKDGNGNAVPNATVTFTAPGSGASATFTGGATAITNASGIATKTVSPTPSSAAIT